MSVESEERSGDRWLGWSFQATDDFDASGREASAKPGDCLSAVAFCLCRDGTSPDDNDVGRLVLVKRDDNMSIGQEPGLLVQGLRAVQAAAERLERDFHAGT